MNKVRIIGLDPGLQHTGWGIIESEGNSLRYVAHGVISTLSSMEESHRLNILFTGLCEVFERFDPSEAAVEEIFLNKNPVSTLKLGMARGVVMLAPAYKSLDVAQYSANKVKKSVVGTGHADKLQVQAMVRRLLPTVTADLSADAADALAVAICHAHHRTLKRLVG